MAYYKDFSADFKSIKGNSGYSKFFLTKQCGVVKCIEYHIFSNSVDFLVLHRVVGGNAIAVIRCCNYNCSFTKNALMYHGMINTPYSVLMSEIM